MLKAGNRKMNLFDCRRIAKENSCVVIQIKGNCRQYHSDEPGFVLDNFPQNGQGRKINTFYLPDYCVKLYISNDVLYTIKLLALI